MIKELDKSCEEAAFFMITYKMDYLYALDITLTCSTPDRDGICDWRLWSATTSDDNASPSAAAFNDIQMKCCPYFR